MELDSHIQAVLRDDWPCHVQDKSAQGGEKAIANCEENALTMPTEATSGFDRWNC